MVTGKRPYSRRARVSTFWRRNDRSLAINREAVTSPARAIPQTPDATPQEEPPRKGGAKPSEKSVIFVPPQIWRLASEIQGFPSPDQRGHDNISVPRPIPGSFRRASAFPRLRRFSPQSHFWESVSTQHNRYYVSCLARTYAAEHAGLIGPGSLCRNYTDSRSRCGFSRRHGPRPPLTPY
jgi:hypothetical protein